MGHHDIAPAQDAGVHRLLPQGPVELQIGLHQLREHIGGPLAGLGRLAHQQAGQRRLAGDAVEQQARPAAHPRLQRHARLGEAAGDLGAVGLVALGQLIDHRPPQLGLRAEIVGHHRDVAVGRQRNRPQAGAVVAAARKGLHRRLQQAPAAGRIATPGAAGAAGRIVGRHGGAPSKMKTSG